MSLLIIERRMRELVERAESDPTEDVGAELAELLARAWDLRSPLPAIAG